MRCMNTTCMSGSKTGASTTVSMHWVPFAHQQPVSSPVDPGSNRDDPDVFRIDSFFERGGTDGEKGTMGMGGTIEEHTTRRRRRWRWRRDRSRRRCDAARSPLPVETRKGSERTFLHRSRRASRLPGRHRRGGKRRRGTGMEKDRHDVEFSQV